ncbi:hypothetical protein GCM10023185_38150 [Hymenobacter saemangeumensis]|uniref:Mannosyl-glycoprotein endo-beta-N-acetylglucosamidase-like domain-containing protein n=1 Tax=Hymenobacter saemangeumensis TaxID=1084522 RepID=A0ABP8IR18_9BACT
MLSRRQFVAKHWALAVEVGTPFGLSPVAMLAHALKESGAGNVRAAARHNYFGFLKGGKHLVYASDRAGFTAYARRLAKTWPAAVRLSHDGDAFAARIAFSANPSYVNESPAARQVYADRLAKIYRAVAADVAHLGLDSPPLATAASSDNDVM